MDFIPVAITAGTKDNHIYSVLRLAVCVFKSGFWSWMSQFRYVHKFMWRVGVAGLYTSEALSVSSQSCDAAVCATQVSLRQFWCIFHFMHSTALLAALFSVLQKTNIISLPSVFPCCICFQLFGGCANLNPPPNLFYSGEIVFCVARVNPCPGIGC